MKNALKATSKMKQFIHENPGLSLAILFSVAIFIWVLIAHLTDEGDDDNDNNGQGVDTIDLINTVNMINMESSINHP